MRGGFNSSFIEIKTLEGDKFIKDLRIGELILTSTGYERLKNVFKRVAKVNDEVYNIYCHSDREIVLDRISGEQVVYVYNPKEAYLVKTKVEDLQPGMMLWDKDEKGVIIDNIEQMETINRFFYNVYVGDNTSYYVENIKIESSKI